MNDEIEELWTLADECSAWAKASRENYQKDEDPRERQCEIEFNRLATKLDEIAKRIAARMPT